MDSYALNAAIKGVIEGVTEFLPISSTGHLVLVRHLFPLTGDPARMQELDNLFDVIIQLPAMLAIVLLYRKRLWDTTRGLMTESRARAFWTSILVAFVPAGVIGFLLKKKLDLLMRPDVVAGALIVGGIILLLVERRESRSGAGGIENAEEVPLWTAFKIGLFQCLSMIPGTSRSAATIIGGRLGGLTRTAAAEFSFFLALPTMLGAFTLKFAKEYSKIQWASDGPILLIGSVTSFLTAWLVVALFMKFLRKNSLSVFGWYRIVLGCVIFFAL